MTQKYHSPHEVQPFTPHHEEHSDANWLVSYADMMTLLVGFFVMLLTFSTIDQGKFEALKRSATKQFGGNYEVPYGEIADRIRKEMEKSQVGDQVVVKQTDLGIEISFLGTVFFDTSSADLKPKGLELLTTLIPIVKAEAKEFRILIEGHTDDVPVAPGSWVKTNWELSGIRASRVLEHFEQAGFKKSLLTAIGYADARPVVSNRNKTGAPVEVNRSQNRRVVIKLLKQTESLGGATSAAGAEQAPASGH